MKKFLYVVSALSLLAFFWFDLRTAAQDVSVQDELALAIAKVGVNEAGWGSPADIALIWQITEGRGRTDEARLAWLRRHSSCVLSNRPMTEEEARGNCRWTHGLAASDEQPEGWPGDAIWQNYVRRWRQIRRLATMLVDGRSDLRPCPETPQTWGGRELDMHQALRRGLRPVGCRETLNEGFVVREVDLL